MSEFYLYGARRDNPDYFPAFENRAGTMGGQLVSQINENLNDELTRLNIKNLMQDGIARAKALSDRQAASMGYSGESASSDFARDYNRLTRDYDEIAYKLIDNLATSVAEMFITRVKGKDAKLNKKKFNTSMIEIAAEQIKTQHVFDKISQNIDVGQVAFWDTVFYSLKDSKSELHKEFRKIVEKRKSERMQGYLIQSKTLGDIGEVADATLAIGIAGVTNGVVTALQSKLSGSNVKIIGSIAGESGKEGKGDIKIGEVIFSTKRYGAIMNDFKRFSNKTIKDASKKDSGADITIQSTGNLQGILQNFESGGAAGVLNGIMDADFYSFMANAIYYNQYGEDQYYEDAMKVLDILTNAYSYVFLVQGTSKNLGYTIGAAVNENREDDLPGFMSFTGQGIVPMYKILEKIEKNYNNILSMTRTKRRLETMAYIKISGQKAAVAAVDHGGKKAEVFNDSMSSNGKYYYRTQGYSPGDPLDAVLSDRYTDFNKRLGTKVKLRVQFNLLQEAIYQAELK